MTNPANKSPVAGPQGIQKSQDHVTVQCPSCTTKFALPQSVLAEHEYPRFHCSRCDNVFAFEDAAVIFPEPRALVPEIDPESQVISAMNSSEDFGSTPSYNPPTTPSPSKSLEIPSSLDENFRQSPPHETRSTPREEVPQMAFDFGMGYDHTAQPIKKAVLEEVRTPTPQPKRKSDSPLTSSPSPARTSTLTSAPTITPEAQYTPEDPNFFAAETTEFFPQDFSNISPQFLHGDAPRYEAAQAVSRWNSLTLATIPLALFLFLLTIVAYTLRSDTLTAGKLLSAWLPAAPEVAPPGLYLKGVTFKKIPLDNGESIHLMQGKVVNSTNEHFRDVQLEGFVFDNSGNPIQGLRVNAASNLAKTKVRSLTSEMIQSLQKDASAKNFELKPGDSQEFAIALLGDKPLQARYYTARIYSVRS